MNLFDLNPQRNLPSAMGWSFREARILQVAVRLKLFTVLNERAEHSTRLAKTLNTDPDMTQRLLIALAGLDLVSHDLGYWRNNVAASLYLVEGKPLYQGDVIELAAEVWHRYSNLERIVRHGRQKDDRLFSMQQHSAWQTLYLKAMHAIAMAGRAQRLARLLPLAGRRKLLDVNGAPGTYTIALCQRFPALQVTLLNRSEAMAQTHRIIKSFACADRIILKEEDAAQKTFGHNEYEALLLSQTLVESESQALVELIKAYDALKTQGLLIVQSVLLDNDLNGGTAAAIANLFDDQFTLEQMQSIIAEAGFERITVLYRNPEEHDILIAYKPTDLPEAPQQELVEFAIPEQPLFFLNGQEEHETIYEHALPSRILTFENDHAKAQRSQGAKKL